MCSFDVGDVMAKKAELFDKVHFAGNCGGLLREMVSLCLAYAIRARLDGNNRPDSVPPCKARDPELQLAKESFFDDLITRHESKT